MQGCLPWNASRGKTGCADDQAGSLYGYESEARLSFSTSLFAAGMLDHAYLQTARILISIDSYEELFAVLGKPAIERSYGSRLILLGMSQPSGTVLSMAVNAVRALRMENVLFLIAVVLLHIADIYRSVYKKYRVFFYVLLFQLILLIVISAYAARSVSIQELIGYVCAMGWLISIEQTLLFFLCFAYLIQVIKEYREAMLFDAVEITEKEI